MTSTVRLAALIAATAAVVALSVASGSLPALIFVLAIVVMVMLHEAGHFVAAKWSGMKVTQFFFGFGPRLWSFQRGETEYGVKAIPAGGYVKIVGMSNVERDVNPDDEPRTYRQQSYPKRMLVAVAGVVTHFVVAFLLLVLVWTVLGVPSLEPRVSEISRLESGASPAAEAGFQLGDEIVAVDGRAISKWDEVPAYVRPRAGEPIRFTVERQGRRVDVSATPVDRDPSPEEVGFLGISATPVTERVNPVTGLGRAAGDMWRLTGAAVGAIGSFFTPASLREYAGLVSAGREGEGSDERFLSVVGVVRMADQAAESSWLNLVYLLVVLNIFVAVFNLVPLLPFDGGHMAVATYERLRSKGGKRYHADISKMTPLAAAVVGILLVIGLTSLYLDIVKPVTNPFQ